MKGRLLEYLLSQPLLCTTEAAELAASLAARDDRDSDPSAELLEARKGRPVDSESGVKVRDGVAVIPVHGPISRHATMFTELCGGTTTAALARDLHAQVNDPAVRAVMLDIDSPGGEGAGIGELAAMIRSANGRKPVCAYVESQAGSAAYWLAAACGEIVCAETSELGSVGAAFGFTTKGDRPGTTSHKFVSTQSPMKQADPTTEAGKSAYQQRADDLAAVFIDNVATLRGTTAEKVTSDFGRGGMLIASKAIAAGMADDVGDFETCLKRLSRGEKAAQPKPKPKPPAGKAKTAKGASMFNPFSVLAKAFAANPEAVTSAMAEEGADVNAVLASLSKPATPPPAEPVVDEVAIRANIAAQFKAQMATEKRDALSAFFSDQGKTWAASLVSSGKIVPAVSARFAALYADFALADSGGPVTFKAADGTDATFGRLGFLKDATNGLKAGSSWTSETVPQDASSFSAAGPLDNCKVLSATATPEETAAADKAKNRRIMLMATDEGKAILAAEAKAK